MSGGSTTLLYRFLGIDAGAGAQFDRMAAKTTVLGDASKASAGKVALLAKAATVTGAVVGVAAVKMASDYQSALTRLVTGAGESMKGMGVVQSSLLKQSGELGVGAIALAKAMYPIESAGFHGAAGVRVLHAAVQGALADGASYTTVADALTTALNAYGLTAADSTRVTNGMVAAVAHGKTTMEDLAASLGNVLPIAAALHVPLQQVLGAMATMTYQGTNAAKASMYLRFAMGALANPTAKAQATLQSMGLSAQTLSDIVAKHGLVAAFTALQDAVGKKFPQGSAQYVSAMANVVGGTRGMQAVLELTGSHLKSFAAQTRLVSQALKQGGPNVEGWSTYTQTLAYSMSRLKAEAEAAMIALGEKLLPVVSSAANWLGKNLPAAISTLAHILGPTAHLVGVVLGDAFHVLGDVLHTAAAALSSVGHLLEQHRGTVTAVTTAVLAMWAAFKLVTIAQAAISGISTLLTTLRVRASLAGMEMRTMSASSALLGTAMAGVGAAVVGLTMNYEENQRVAAETKAGIEAYTQALNADNGALAEHTRKQAYDNLESAGAYEWGLKLGISQRTLTSAALGSAPALRAVADATRLGGDAAFHVNQALGANIYMLGEGAKARQNYKAAMDKSTTATVQGAAAADHLAASTNTSTGATNGFTTSLKNLATQFLKTTNTLLGLKQSQAQYLDSLHSMKQAIDTSNGSLAVQSVKGRAAYEQLLSAAQGALAMDDGTRKANASLLTNIESLRQQAIQAGASKTRVDSLLHSLNLMPSQIRTRLTVDTSQASNALDGISQKINGIVNGYHQVTLTVVEHGGIAHGNTGSFTGNSRGSAAPPILLRDPGLYEQMKQTVIAAVHAAQQALRGTLRARRGAISSLSGSLSGDLSGMFGTDVNGNPATANVNTFLGGQRKTLEKFAKDLKWGARHGLSPALLSEIAGLGAVQGDEVLQQFRSGAASITAADRAEAAIQRYSRGAASTVEDKVYARQLAKERKDLHEQTTELKGIRHLLQHPPPQGGGHFALSIQARAGQPVVDAKFTDDIIKAIKRAERIAGKKLV